MRAVRIAHRSLGLAAAQPATWVICCLLFLSWPLWVLTAPTGITSHSSDDSWVLYNVAIASFAIGAVRGIGPAVRLSRTMVMVSSPPGLPTRMLAVGSIALLHALVASIPAVFSGALRAEPDPWALGVRLTLVFLTIVSFSSLLLHFEVEAGSASWLLGVVILLAPFLLPEPLPPRSLLLLSAALLSASWLLDHSPGRTT